MIGGPDTPEREKDHDEVPDGPMRGAGAGNDSDQQAPPDGEPVPNTDAEQGSDLPRGPHTPPAVGSEGEAEGDVATDTPDAPAASSAAPADDTDYKDLYLRARAETENVRKRGRRDAGSAEQRGVGRLAKELLPALDNFDRALAAAEHGQEGETELTRGLRLVQQELTGALTRVGIAADSPKGQPFDPHRHEALAQQPVEGAETAEIEYPKN